MTYVFISDVPGSFGARFENPIVAWGSSYRKEKKLPVGQCLAYITLRRCMVIFVSLIRCVFENQFVTQKRLVVKFRIPDQEYSITISTTFDRRRIHDQFAIIRRISNSTPMGLDALLDQCHSTEMLCLISVLHGCTTLTLTLADPTTVPTYMGSN